MTDRSKITNAKNRPFLVVQYFRTPAEGQHTELKDNGKREWNVKEDVTIVSHLKHKHLVASDVIIDILQAKVTKNRFEDATNDDIYKHYMEKYKNDIQDALGNFIKKNYPQMIQQQINVEDSNTIDAEIVQETVV